MVFIPDPDTDPTTPKDSIRVPEHYPSTDDRAPFDHREDVRIRGNATFEDFYEICGEPLGEGKFGKVYQCRERTSGLELAAKFIKIRKDADRKTVEREVSIMTQMMHPRIAQIYDAFYNGKTEVILVMEIVRGGELFNRVAEESYILTEKAVAIIICQLCEAIDYMHSQNIIHLDIKPENIMCVSETGNSIKLIDFGLAQLFDPTKDLYLMAGTPEFAAPEVIKYEPLDYRTDMWSVGVITYILLSGYSPFLGDTTPETYVNVERGEWAFTEEFDYVTPAAKDFITRLLTYDKFGRLLPSECLQHEWIAGVRSVTHNEAALRSTSPLGPALESLQLRRYVLRRRFKKIGLVVRTCVEMRMRQLARAKLAVSKEEAVDEVSMASSAPDITTATDLQSEAVMASSPDEVSMQSEAKPLKKKKKTKPKMTVSSETERPSEKKPKRAEPSESSKENASLLPAPVPVPELAAAATEAKEKTPVKKRNKNDPTMATTSSTEMPAPKVSKKSSADKKARDASKSPSPQMLELRRETSPIPIIYEELVKADEPEKKAKKEKVEGEVKKRKPRPKSTERTTAEKEEGSMAGASSGSLLVPPDRLPLKKSLSASTSTVEETKKAEVDHKVEGLAVAKLQSKSGGSGSLIGARIQQLAAVAAPAIVVQPPTPAGARAARKPGEGRIEAMKKRLWKQEKPEGKGEEVIVLNKGEAIAPLVMAVQDSGLKLAKKKTSSIENGRLKEEQEKVDVALKKDTPEPQSTAKILPISTEKSTTTTKVTTTKVKRNKHEEETGVVVEGPKRVEQSENKKTETEKVSISHTETKEEKTGEESEKPKKTVKKTVMKKTTTTASTKKTRTEGEEKSESEQIVTSSIAHHQADRISITHKTKVNDELEKDASLKLGKDVKKKLVVKNEAEPKLVEEKAKKQTSALFVGKETVSLVASDGKTGETIKKSTTTKTKLIASHADKNANIMTEMTDTEESSRSGEKPKKKRTVVKKQKSMPIDDKPLIEYPASIALDIEMLKATRVKAKAREEEMQRRVRFAMDDEKETQSVAEPTPYYEEARSARLERTISEGSSDSSNSRRRSSFFEVTEDEQDTLAAAREDFSFSTLRKRLERQLTNRGTSPATDEEIPRPKELIRCPSTNSLLKKWRNFEQTHV